VTLLSNIIECRDFTVIFPILSKIRRDFGIFLPWFSSSPINHTHNQHTSQSTIILTMTLTFYQSINQSIKKF